MSRESWTFSNYMYELEYAAEITEIPGITEFIQTLVKEVKERFPEQAKEYGIE